MDIKTLAEHFHGTLIKYVVFLHGEFAVSLLGKSAGISSTLDARYHDDVEYASRSSVCVCV